ncbi:hypothetical protein A2U01_0062457, partial [Trifolium medium]|nr:hypothetical protein [Trifolium medium]
TMENSGLFKFLYATAL